MPSASLQTSEDYVIPERSAAYKWLLYQHMWWGWRDIDIDTAADTMFVFHYFVCPTLLTFHCYSQSPPDEFCQASFFSLIKSCQQNLTSSHHMCGALLNLTSPSRKKYLGIVYILMETWDSIVSSSTHQNVKIFNFSKHFHEKYQVSPDRLSRPP